MKFLLRMNIKKYIYRLALTFLPIMTATGCSDNLTMNGDEPGGEEPQYESGYSLSFSVSLDDMGGPGTRISAAYGDDKLKEYENYIDVEKFRVLFFDSEDKFLFESKNRWIKKLDTGPDVTKSEWYVSVPFFTYGNEDAWDWGTIRKALTKGNFKIALLVNRPDKDWYPGFAATSMANQAELSAPGWIDNTGPHWTPQHTGVKNIFDLHHCQYDRIYTAKGDVAKYYDFIMEVNGDATRPELGATSSWVDWDGSSSMKTGKRPFRMPSYDHPIPMYGVQVFDKISETEWREGTTYKLTRTGVDKSISLLRSVVRLELLIPRNVTGLNDPNFVALCYPNVYARCEPMDVWTPTDQLWSEENKGNTVQADINTCSEINRILKYGVIAKNGDANPSTKIDYQKRLAWFYGAWMQEKGWDFGTHSSVLKNSDVEGIIREKGIAPPKIFNSCIQRNSVVYCDNNKVNDNSYFRYVVYTGERNINDPSDLNGLGNSNSGKPTVVYWMFNQGSKLYAAPITDYSNNKNPAYSITVDTHNTTVGSGEEKHKYMNDTYMQNIMSKTDIRDLPWPLVRNHVYRIYIGKTKGEEKGTLGDFVINCEDLHSEDISHYPSAQIP